MRLKLATEQLCCSSPDWAVSAASLWRSGSLDLIHRPRNGLVHLVSDVLDLALAVEGLAHLLVGLDELLQLHGQLVVLLVQQSNVAVQRVDLGL